MQPFYNIRNIFFFHHKRQIYGRCTVRNKRDIYVIDVISTSEVSIALTLDNTAELDKIVTELERLGDVEIDPGYAVICVVGEGLRASTGLASTVFSTIEDINVALISHGASSVNLTFVIKEDEAANVIKRLHQELF